jgi:UDP-2,4-diacetamido-2,4,6-trideoxy-beta-L-altropyranose hydrolase
MPAKTLFIRADASAEIGAGHVMRCLALAQAWQKTDGSAIFALAAGGIELESRIRSEGAEVVRIHAQPGSREDADQTMSLCTRLQAEWLVIDGYHFSANYRRSMRSASPNLLLMDDGLETQPCECDVILNPDPDAAAGMYSQRDTPTELLLGPRYALLRREFLEFHNERSDIAQTATRVLVTLGGGDHHNVTLQVVEAMQGLNDLELDITVVIGPSYEHRESLQAAIAKSTRAATLLCNVANMPELMARADLAITAGGGTCYELAFMKVPMFLITMAKNHERAVDSYARAGAAFNAGWFSSLERSTLAACLRRVICDPELRRKLMEYAARMIDGKGASRVVEAMHAICHRRKKVTA